MILNNWYLVFFCWFPFYMLRLLYNFTPWLNDRCPSFETFWYGSMALANINSCLNPILYAGLNTRWGSDSSRTIPRKLVSAFIISGNRSYGIFFLTIFLDFEKMHVNFFWNQTKILFLFLKHGWRIVWDLSDRLLNHHRRVEVFQVFILSTRWVQGVAQ